MKDIKEFWLVWFESSQEWKVILPPKTILEGVLKWGAVGYAHSAALYEIGAGESDFDCEENNGAFLHYIKAPVSTMDQLVDKINALHVRLGRYPKFFPVTRNDVRALAREVIDVDHFLDEKTRQLYLEMSETGIFTPGSVHTFMGIPLKQY